MIAVTKSKRNNYKTKNSCLKGIVSLRLPVLVKCAIHCATDPIWMYAVKGKLYAYISYSMYMDKVQSGVYQIECILSCITLCPRSELIYDGQ